MDLDDVTISWIELRYSAVDTVADDPDDEDFNQLIKQWQVDVIRVSEAENEQKIGWASLASFDLTLGIDWWDAGDALGEDIFRTCAEVLFQPGTDGLRPDVDEQFDDFWPDQVLLFNHLTLDPDERGRGLGRKIVQTITVRLAEPDALLVAYPQPDGWQDMPPNTLTKTRHKIETTWSEVGFLPFKDGVWLMYPARSA